jgi:hypothetical protein
MKYVGGGMVLAFALVYCMVTGHRMKEVRHRLRSWITLLTHMRSHIACFGTPLRDILRRTDHSILAPLGLTEVVGNECVLSDHFRADAFQLPGESGALLCALADELGTVWQQQQLERLDYYIEALRREYDTYSKALTETLKLRDVLCLCASLGILLLVW